MVAIGFTVLLSGKVLEMTEWLKANYPEIEIVLGGYGTAIFREKLPIAQRLEMNSNHICFGDGIAFFRELIFSRYGLKSPVNLQQKLIPVVNSLFRSHITLYKQHVFVKGLGCTSACSFCSTSAQFRHQYLPMFSAELLIKSMEHRFKEDPEITSYLIYDEDFLSKRDEIMHFIEQIEASDLQKSNVLLTVFASLQSIRQFTPEELIRCRIGTIFIGVESLSQNVLEAELLKKRRGDVVETFNLLHSLGINTLGSLVVGWDEQDKESTQKDIDSFIALNPTFYQIVPLHPVPGTRLWEKIKQEERIIPEYRIEHDGISSFNYKTKNFSHAEGLEMILYGYKRLVQYGGPWPVRVLENMFSGIETTNQTFPFRANTYKRTAKQLLPLFFASVLIIRGFAFWRKWLVLAKKSFGQFPVLSTLWIISSPFIAVILSLTYRINQIRQFLSRSGDQPEKIRKAYKPYL